MKTLVLHSLLIFTLLLSMLSCTQENASDNTVQEQIEQNTSSGDWKISNFNDSGTDETNHFNGFTFTFQANGTLIADNGSVTYTGNWSISDSNSSDDSVDDLHFNISFNLTNDFQDLNDDWEIISFTSTTLELTDVSGGNGGVDFLTFTKL